MAKIQIKSEKLTPLGGIFSIMEQFDSTLSSVIDSTLGLRCGSFGYQYSEIIRSLMSIYFCGGSCIEGHMKYLMFMFCDKVAKNQVTIIEKQTTIENGMTTIACNQVILSKQMKNFGLSETKQTEVQGKFDEMAVHFANKFVNAIQDKCDRYIKRIESSDQAFIIPPVAT